MGYRYNSLGRKEVAWVFFRVSRTVFCSPLGSISCIGRTEGRNHEKSNQERDESEKSVTNFVKNRVQDGQFVSIPGNSKVSQHHYLIPENSEVVEEMCRNTHSGENFCLK